jgi:hypothetical protein
MHSEKLPSKKQFEVIKMIATVKEPNNQLGKLTYEQFTKAWKALFDPKRAFRYVCSANAKNGVSIAYFGNTWEDAVTGEVTNNDMERSGIECDVCDHPDYEGEGQMPCIVSEENMYEFVALTD